MSPSFCQSMKPLLDDTVTYFLPSAALTSARSSPQSPATGRASCRNSSDTPWGGPGDLDPPSCRSSPQHSGDLDSDLNQHLLQSASSSRPGGGPGDAGTSKKRDPLVPEAASGPLAIGYPKKEEVPPSEVTCGSEEGEGQGKSALESLREDWSGIQPCTKAKSATVRESATVVGSPSVPLGEDGTAQNPITLTFKSPELENMFKIRQALSSMRTDFWFSLFILLIILGFQDPATRKSIFSCSNCAVVLVQVLAIILFPAWYARHREWFCFMHSPGTPFFYFLAWRAYLLSPGVSHEAIKQCAHKLLWSVPFIHASEYMGHKVRFFLALWKGGGTFLITLWMDVKVAGPAWGWSLPRCLAMYGLPLVITHAVMLPLVRKWEKEERIQFLASLQQVS
eukprot:jgi/Botrbrau1/22279/Bobra.0138s0032.2